MFHGKKALESKVSALKMQYPDDCNFVASVTEDKALYPLPQTAASVSDIRAKVKARFSKTIEYLAK